MARPNKLIQLYLTNVCNSKCNTCKIWQNWQNSRENIPLDKVFDILYDFPNADYVFGGGEFTLYREFGTLLNIANKMNINYTILSNAINKNIILDLPFMYNIKNLTISCDGVNHDKIRGVSGNLDNIIIIVKELKNKIDNFKISYTLSSLNETNIDKDMQFFKSIGFDKVYFCIAQNMDLLKSNDNNIIPKLDSVKYLLNNYSDMLYDKDIKLLSDICEGKHKTCDSTNDVHTIYSNGDVVRCQSFKSKEVLGNIYKNSLKEILENSERLKECPYNDICNLVCQRRYDYE